MLLDGHAHVFMKNLPMDSDRRYTPASDALPEIYFSYLRQHGLDGAVLVQPSFLGTDNSYLLKVLDKNLSDPNGLSLYGVCMTKPNISIDEIQELKARKVIGIRLNCVKREIPDLQSRLWQSFISKIHDADWHLELHIESDRLLSVLDTLPPKLNTVIDHFCLAGSESELAELLKKALNFIDCGSLFVKASAPYRLPTSGDNSIGGNLAPSLAGVLIDTLGAKQVIWGSDWPFTEHEKLQDYKTCVLQSKSWFARESELFADFPIRLLGQT